MKTGSFQNLACRKDKMNKNNFSKIAEKRGAMEMSMGTLVTIVLLMTALILGLVMVRTIFFSATDNINQIDQAVKNEITKLFSEDNNKKVVIYPSGRQITIKKGNDIDLGFAFSIRNIDVTSGSFHYDVKVKSIENKCQSQINEAEAEDWIAAGGSGDIEIPAGSAMENPEFVRFRISDNAPPCLIRYGIEIKKDGQIYGSTISIDVQIVSA